ncbi:MAG: hypothetical protein R2941_12160 [Desulfobacterales bacterium]
MEQEFVLIVDDEREMRIFLSTQFELGGYRANYCRKRQPGH